ILSVSGVLANSLVCAAIVKNRSLRVHSNILLQALSLNDLMIGLTSSNTILVSLCASDLLYGLVTVPMQVACAVFMVNDLCIVTDTLVKFISVSTIIHILLITVDRYIFIVYALRYYAIVRKRRVVGTLLGVWSVNAVITLVRLHWALRVDKIFNWFCLITFFFVPLLFTIILDAKLLSVLRTQIRKIVQDNLLHIRKKQIIRTKNRERRAVCVYLVVVTTFILCWLPYFLY
ncbi:predicted protein, partial [Nematostella vectensis]